MRGWSLAPSEFWAMTIDEFWVLFDQDVIASNQKENGHHTPLKVWDDLHRQLKKQEESPQ